MRGVLGSSAKCFGEASLPYCASVARSKWRGTCLPGTQSAVPSPFCLTNTPDLGFYVLSRPLSKKNIRGLGFVMFLPKQTPTARPTSPAGRWPSQVQPGPQAEEHYCGWTNCLHHFETSKNHYVGWVFTWLWAKTLKIGTHNGTLTGEVD